MGDTMRYSGLIRNDLTAAPGVSVTFFTQGCPHRCKGCHNPETWDFDGGKDFTVEILNDIDRSISANGVERNFCIMGGEPLCEENSFLTCMVISEVKRRVPKAKIYIWSGYTYEHLSKSGDSHVRDALTLADVLIDGPYIEAQRDITLPMRGSRNQRVIDLSKKN